METGVQIALGKCPFTRTDMKRSPCARPPPSAKPDMSPRKEATFFQPKGLIWGLADLETLGKRNDHSVSPGPGRNCV